MYRPKSTVGPVTLQRRLGTGGIGETWLATLDDDGGRKVVARFLHPSVRQDPARLAMVAARVHDLRQVQHPLLLGLIDLVEAGEERIVLEPWVDGLGFDRILAWCERERKHLPPAIFLHVATQICNALEALHSRPGSGADEDFQLHLGLRPAAIFLSRDGRLLVGGYGLVRSPMMAAQLGGLPLSPVRVRYQSPEQTWPEQRLTPSSDLFSLGTLLYEMVTLKPLFSAESPLQTVAAVRRAELGRALDEVSARVPGLERVLSRALTANARQRYQRGFVIREELRGLMAGYSFTTIHEELLAFLGPILAAEADEAPAPDLASPAPAPSARVAPGMATPMTGAAATVALAGFAGDEHSQLVESLEDDGGDLEAASGPGEDDAEELFPAAGLRVGVMRDEDSDEHDAPMRDDRVHADAVKFTEAARGHGEDVDPAFFEELGAEEGGTDEDPSLHMQSPAGLHADEAPSISVSPAAQGVSAVRIGRPAPPAVRPPPPEEEVEDLADFGDEDLGADEPPPPAPIRPAPIRLAPHEPATQAAPPSEPAPASEPPAAHGPTLIPLKTTSFSPKQEAAPVVPAPVAPAPVLPAPTLAPPPPAAAAPPTVPAAPPAPQPAPVVAAPPSSAKGAGTTPPPVAASRTTPPPVASPPRPPPQKVTTTPPPAARPPSQGKGSQLGPVIGVMLLVGAVCAVGTWMVIDRAEPELATATPPTTPVAEVKPTPEPILKPPEVVEVPPAPVAEAPVAEPPPAEVATPAPDPAARAAAEAEAQARAAAKAAADAEAKAAAEERARLAAEEKARKTAEARAAAEAKARADAEAKAAAKAAADEKARLAAEEKARKAAEARAAAAAKAQADAEAKAVAKAAAEEKARLAAEEKARKAAEAKAKADLAKAKASTKPTLAPQEKPLGDAVLSTPVASPPSVDLNALARPALDGELSPDDVADLEAIPQGDPAYTRARTLLLTDAQGKGDNKAIGRYLDQIMAVPENRYNPLYLTEQARHLVNQGQYALALEAARKAEQQWARLPSDVLFAKKAEIFEIEAASTQGLYYRSGGDGQLLDQAISSWERYRDHVASRGRTDLVKRADKQLSLLEDFRANAQ